MFGRLFGRGKPKVDPEASINRMGTTEETLGKRVRFLEKKIDEELGKAKQLIREGKKPQALVCIKRKKQYEGQLGRLNQQMLNIGEMKGQLENAALEKEVLDANIVFAAAMKEVMGGKTADDIADELDQAREAMDDARELSELMGQPLGGGIDDFELEDEMAGLEAEMAAEDLADLEARVSTPTTELPARRVAPAEEEEPLPEPTEEEIEAEFRMLAAGLS